MPLTPEDLDCHVQWVLDRMKSYSWPFLQYYYPMTEEEARLKREYEEALQTMKEVEDGR